MAAVLKHEDFYLNYLSDSPQEDTCDQSQFSQFVKKDA